MSGNVYTISMEKAAVSVALEVFSIDAPSDAVLEILSCRVGQLTLEGDANAEMLSIKFARFSGAQDATGTGNPTARPHNLGGAASGAVVESGCTGTSATQTTVLEDGWNVQAGWLYLPIPEERFWISPSQGFVVNLEAPTSMTVTGSLTWREYGG